MKTIAFLIVFLLSSPVWAADEWSKQDIALEITWEAIHLIDTLQTRQIARDPEGFAECNPILGRHPSEDKVLLYMGTGAVLHPVITHYLPKRYRPYFQGITIGLSGGCVMRNFHIGLGVKW